MAIIKMRFSSRTIGGLKDLVNDLPNGITMVEIGCYAGESADIFLSSGKIAKYYAVDPWVNGYDKNDGASSSELGLAEIEFDKVVAKYPNVNIIKLKDFSEAAASKVTELVDFVYIDANHLYDAVKTDITIWREKIKPNGMIGGHDYGNRHRGVKQAVDEFYTTKKTYRDTSWMVKL
jgi:hypothetical protein